MNVPALSPQALHFGTDQRVLFGWLHGPKGRSRRTGVVLCNPIGDDYVRAHRAIRHLAEHLSRAGFSVLRFDFRGTGDSAESERTPARVKAWTDDVRLAVDELRGLSDANRIAVVGLGLGATISMASLAEHAVDSLVLWAPYPNGSAYVRDTTQMHKMHKLLEPEGFASVPKQWQPGGLEALGFLLTPETCADLRSIDLYRIARAPATRTLVVDSSDAPAQEPLTEHLRRIGAAADYRHIPGERFLVQIPHESDLPSATIDAIVAWLSERHAIDAAAGELEGSSRGAPPAGAPYGEQPVWFGSTHPLFGVLVRPSSIVRDPKLPAIIMTNAGCVHRIGPHRFYVSMARRWAALGFWVFRIDLSGIGDSPAPPGCVENITYPRDGVKDLEDAMTYLTQHVGAQRFIVLGLCSGGDLAFQLGFKDERVAGAVIMNPRTFCVHDLEMVEEFYARGWPFTSLARAGSWRKLLYGQVDLQRAVKRAVPGVARLIKRRLGRLLLERAPGKRNGENRDKPDLREAPSNDVAACLRRMADRGVDTFLIASAKDPGVDYVDHHFAEDMRALEGVARFRREDMPGTDHTFTSLYSQEEVARLITEHFLRHHAS